MVLSNKQLDQIRQAIADGENPEALADRITGVTVGAAIESCCAGWYWEFAPASAGRNFFSALSAKFPTLNSISATLKGVKSAKRSSGVFDPLTYELWAVQRKEDLEGDGFGLFQMRFSRSLERAGFAKELARSIAVSLGEMTDNIVQHAHQPATAHGIVAYQVASRAMCFVVADVGEGVLKSLSRSPKWQHLRTDKEALSAAVCHGATSRASATEGAGFKQVHRALASYNGYLRFRSGKSALTLSGQAEPRTAVTNSVAGMGGFQLVISCDLEKKGERFLLTHSFN